MKNKEIFEYGIKLFFITFVVSLVLSSVNMLTKDKIESITLQEQDEAKKAVLTGVEYTKITPLNLSGEDPIIAGAWVAENDSLPAAYVVNVKPNGYGGIIDIMVGIDLDLAVLDVKIISHSETAGLGSKAQQPEFTSQFKGGTKDMTVYKNKEPSKDEIIAISGATVTTNAVVNGVKSAIEEISKIAASTKPLQEGGSSIE